eukprot:TRINITY_DN3194_c0_g1_i1.p1 TRINITY_DN3194_c0_g1~~TRINITY_DN3194_c0_g1_i1.p1  ORF type:complete len:329 (+),score=54.75 TRINITY_DN3194_c0_g1_i1:140-988(+)
MDVLSFAMNAVSLSCSSTQSLVVSKFPQCRALHSFPSVKVPVPFSSPELRQCKGYNNVRESVSFTVVRQYGRHRSHFKLYASLKDLAEGNIQDTDVDGLLNGIEVLAMNGDAVTVTSIWANNPAVVAWVRHFGCPLCRRRAALLAERKEEMDRAGVRLAVIGPGKLEQAKAFLEQTSFPGDVFADPSFSSYAALNFAYGVNTTFNPAGGLNLAIALAEGYRLDWELSSDPVTRTRGGWQQGGILVAGPGPNAVKFLHKDKAAGDEPDLNNIIEACCSLPMAA